MTNLYFEVFDAIFTEDASLLLLCCGAEKSKLTKNSNQGGLALMEGGGHKEQVGLVEEGIQQVASKWTEEGIQQAGS